LIDVSLFLIEVSLIAPANATRSVAALVRERLQVTEVPGRDASLQSDPQNLMTGSAALLTVGPQPNAMQNAGQWLQCGKPT
jgi:hypothetical protein